MHRTLWWLLVVGCGGAQRAEPTAPPAAFCAALLGGDVATAGAAAHAALVEGNAEASRDATEPLVAWLRQQSCVSRVVAPAEVVETEPAIREIEIDLASSDGSARRCDADLTLAPGAHVSIHAASWSSANPDTHCTVVPAMR